MKSSVIIPLIKAKILYQDMKEILDHLDTINDLITLDINYELFEKQILSETELKVIYQPFTMSEIIFIKHGLTTVANIVDFNNTIRSLYAQHPEISEEYKKNEHLFDFAKYMRHKFTSHIDEELIDIAIQWNPVLAFDINNPLTNYSAYNVWIIEALMNTYTDQNGEHKIWKSQEINLVTRFGQVLFKLTISDMFIRAIYFLKKVIQILQDLVPADYQRSNIKSQEEKVLTQQMQQEFADQLNLPITDPLIEALFDAMRISEQELNAYQNTNKVVFEALKKKGR